MKEKDLQLISYLRQNARISLTKLSKKTGMPVSTIFLKIKSNFNGRILKHTALIDFSAFGYNLKAFLLLKVKKDQKDDLIKKLNNCDHVNNLYKINNSWDVIVECIFKNLNHLEDFLEEIEEKFTLKAKEVHYVLADLKKEAFLSGPETISIL